MDEILVTFHTNDKIIGYLEKLARSGLYGRNLTEAAERLVSRGIEDLIVSGLLDETKAKEDL